MAEFDFLVEDAVRKRYSVRTYDKRPVEKEVKEKILAYADRLENPIGPKMKIQFIEKELAPNGERLGTYGIIKGAGLYLGATISKSYPNASSAYVSFEMVAPRYKPAPFIIP